MTKEASFTVNTRLGTFIDSLGITNNGFSKRVGVAPSMIGNITGGRQGKPSYELLEKIAMSHPSLSLEWLIRGEGQMLRGDAGESDCQKQLKTLTGKYADLEDDFERATAQLERLKRLESLK
jgi:transcriptional regulator with XRE-family HTH domain